jgi:RNA 2',3'-cyclic 3'-phosphodiesterase
MRVFLAIELPPALKTAIAQRLEAVSPRLPSARYTAAGTLHLTLHFFGERTSERVAAVAAALEPIVAAHTSFHVELAKAGSFPASAPRVVWLGFAPSRELGALQRDVTQALAVLGEEIESRPFHPHLTLARVKAPWRSKDIDTLRKAMCDLEGERFAVESVTIFESHLSGKSAQHEARRVLKLLGNERAAT